MEGLSDGAYYQCVVENTADNEPQPAVVLLEHDDKRVIVKRLDTGRIAHFDRKAFERKWERWS